MLYKRQRVCNWGCSIGKEILPVYLLSHSLFPFWLQSEEIFPSHISTTLMLLWSPLNQVAKDLNPLKLWVKQIPPCLCCFYLVFCYNYEKLTSKYKQQEISVLAAAYMLRIIGLKKWYSYPIWNNNDLQQGTEMSIWI